ncbi:MAG: hypothetical protein ABI418_12635 [Jatrophihabitantaceae bacterium]
MPPGDQKDVPAGQFRSGDRQLLNPEGAPDESPVSSMPPSHYLQQAASRAAATSRANMAAKATDSDGDNDGSTAASGRLDIKI